MAKTIMMVVGVVFILIGILGFISHPILGIFGVNTLHNVVHLASGILALVFASQGEAQARRFALILGVVYALVTILGFLGALGFLAVNRADNALHLVLAVVFLIVGLKKPAMASSAM